jgi:hypothetical protein
VIHSVLFLAGSIGFIPVLDIAVVGVWIFIVASLWVSIAELRRVCRLASRNGADLAANSTVDTNHDNYNVLPGATTASKVSPGTKSSIVTCIDWDSVWAASFAAAGGLSYIAGSVLFLPQVGCDADIAALIFTIGGACFCLSATAPLLVVCCSATRSGADRLSSGDVRASLNGVHPSSCQHAS